MSYIKKNVIAISVIMSAIIANNAHADIYFSHSDSFIDNDQSNTFESHVESSSIKDQLTISYEKPEVMLYGESHDIDIIVTNNTSNPIPMSPFFIGFSSVDFGRPEHATDSWSVDAPFENCRFVGASFRGAIFSDRGDRYRCDPNSDLMAGESALINFSFDANRLANYQILGSIGNTTIHQRLVVDPDLTDTDGDGVIDVEEELSGSDPMSANDVPGDTILDMILFYTPEFAEKYSPEDRNTFFSEFIEFSHSVFHKNNIRIKFNLLHTIGIDTERPEGFDPYGDRINDMRERTRGFEVLAELDQERYASIVGVVDTLDDLFRPSRGQLWVSGSVRSHFASVDNFGVMLHEIGHNLGAHHEYELASESVGGEIAYSFSYGYQEEDRGSIMSSKMSPPYFFSSPTLEECGLSRCGIWGHNPSESSNNALTLNLSRLFMENTAPMDQDYNGIPDWWEESHDLRTDHIHCEDPDSDGVPNAGEYRALTNPNDPSSHPSNYELSSDCEEPEPLVKTYTTDINSPLEIDMKIFDSKGRPMKVEPIGSFTTKYGTVTSDGLGSYTYAPNDDVQEVDEIVFTVSNGIAGSAEHRVIIEIGSASQDAEADPETDLNPSEPSPGGLRGDSGGGFYGGSAWAVLIILWLYRYNAFRILSLRW